jgi:cellulose synthase/poly-beta-1,6-N-acetylglucosamine synthase-like glycosyltransferase
MPNSIAWTLVLGAAALFVYTYLGYPLLLRLLSRWRPGHPSASPPSEWPVISISVPVYNEEQQIRGLIESLLAIDYPADRRQILIVSDCSTDGTDEIVAEYADRGVELLRMPSRGGKTAAESAAAARLRGEVVINTDASIRIRPDAMKALVARFSDPTVGVASGRDLSVARIGDDANAGESGYVGYEMWVRQLETRTWGIIGASGCFYAIRTELQHAPLAPSLSRDFAAALIAREHGYRAVSVDEALCYVPRAASLQREYRRKVRTITRGMETLMAKRALLNPFRYGLFAWMLWSHKLCRWLVPWAGLVALAGIAILSMDHLWARLVLAGAAVLCGLAAIGWARSWRGADRVPRLFAVPAFAIAGNIAAIQAALHLLHGDRNPIWEPTRRDVLPVS